MTVKSVQPGEILTLTAPTGGVVAGLGYFIGSIFVVALSTVAQTLPFPGATEGVFTLAKKTGTAWTEGQLVYWDATNSRATVDKTEGRIIGAATAVAASGAAIGNVNLNEAVAPGTGAGLAVPADLTMGTNVTAATANGSIEDSAATNPSDVNFNNNMKEFTTRINQVLAILRTLA